MNKVNVILKFILFLMNFDRDFLKKAFAAASKVQHIGESYFWDKYQVEIKYSHRCPELAIMCVLTEMADKSQQAFIDYVFSHYKCGRYDE